MEANSSYVNKSLDRALRLLNLFDDAHVHLTASDIAELLATTRATIYPTLHTLLAHRYLDRDDQGRYVLGMKLVERSGEKLAHLDVRQIARGPLRELARRLGANAHLATLHGNEVLYLEREEGRPTVTLREVVGRRVSPHCTALGKSLLAFLPDEDRAQIVHSLDYVHHTPNTITNPEDLIAELDLVRKRGYALEIEEFHLGSACISAPIRGLNGRVIAAVSVSMATEDLLKRDLDERATSILDAASAISGALGYREKALESRE